MNMTRERVSSVTSPIEVGYIRLRQYLMPNSGKPELGGRGGSPPLRRAGRIRLLAITAGPDTKIRSRGAMRPSYARKLSRLEIRGRGECRMRAAPAVSRAKLCKKRTRAY